MLSLLIALAWQAATVTAGPHTWSFGLPGSRLSFAQLFCALPGGKYQASIPYDQLFALPDAQLPIGCEPHRNEPATDDRGNPARTITYMVCIPPGCAVSDPATCLPPPCPLP